MFIKCTQRNRFSIVVLVDVSVARRFSFFLREFLWDTNLQNQNNIFRHREDKKEEKRLQRKSCKDAEPRKGDEIFYCVHKHRHTNVFQWGCISFPLRQKVQIDSTRPNLPASIARYEKLHVQWVFCAKKGYTRLQMFIAKNVLKAEKREIK